MGRIRDVSLHPLVYIGGGVCVYTAYWLYTFRPRNFPPGPKPLPFLGTLYHEEKQEEELVHLEEKYGPVFSVSKFGVKPNIIVNDYEIYKREIKAITNIYVDRPILPINEMFNVDKGIVFGNEPYWSAARKLSIAALKKFGMGKGEMVDSLWEEANNMINAIDVEFEKCSSFDPAGFVRRSVMNVIIELVFGDRLEYDDPAFEMIIDALELNLFTYDDLTARVVFEYAGIFKYIPEALYKNNPEFLKLYKFLDYVDDQVQKIENLRKPGESNSIVELFVEEKNSNSKSILAQPNVLGAVIVDIFSAGSDTTQNTIRWGLQHLCRDEKLQELLYAESLKVVGDRNKPALTDLHEMPIMNAFLHEVMRDVSLIPQGVSHCPTENVKLQGYDIPAGTPVLLNLYAVHHDPRYWKYPNSFNIKNFLNDNGEFAPPAQFIPFGWGRRICAGSALARAENFVMILKIIQEYKISFPKEYSMERIGDIIRRPSNQKLVFTKRMKSEVM